MAKKSTTKPKIGKIELTPQQRDIIAQNVDSEFFKIITEVIIPQRVTQIALTALHGDQDTVDLFYHKGMAYIATWIGDFLTGEAEKVDDAVYDNDDDGLGAVDDDPDS